MLNYQINSKSNYGLWEPKTSTENPFSTDKFGLWTGSPRTENNDHSKSHSDSTRYPDFKTTGKRDHFEASTDSLSYTRKGPRSHLPFLTPKPGHLLFSNSDLKDKRFTKEENLSKLRFPNYQKSDNKQKKSFLNKIKNKVQSLIPSWTKKPRSQTNSNPQTEMPSRRSKTSTDSNHQTEMPSSRRPEISTDSNHQTEMPSSRRPVGTSRSDHQTEMSSRRPETSPSYGLASSTSFY